MSSTKIPRHIWTYWNEAQVPEIVNKCIETWRKNNPDYEITVITRDTIKDYITDPDILSLRFAQTPQQIADLVRAHVLAKYGGIWCDASIIMNKSLEDILDDSYDFIGYIMDDRTPNPDLPYLENWFFACKPNTPFINKWRDEYTSINNYERIEDYIEKVNEKNIDLRRIDGPTYLTMHVAAKVVMNDMTDEEKKTQIKTYSADKGPFKFMFDNEWDSEKGVKSLCNIKDHPVFHKLRGNERSVLVNSPEVQKCMFT